VTVKQSQLEAIIEPVVTSLGYVLWGTEFISQGRHSVLRVFIDHEDGITLEACEAVSRQVSAVMDVEDPITDEYTLEVSSPGLDRPLFKLEQYSSCVGSLVNLRLRAPFEGRRRYKGIVKGVEGQDVVIETDGHELLLPIESIEKAQVIPQFE